jgi:alkylation response protein AidB-like acyl-CoA dehydrogenase
VAINFDLNEGQALLQTSVREFLTQECPEALVRESEESDLGYSPQLWQKLADVGFLGLGIPEPYGGAGSTFFDLGLFFEEAGRVLMPGPQLATLAIVAQAIAGSGTEEQKQRYLQGIASGQVLFAFALNERDGESRPQGVETTAERDGDAYVIDGTKMFIKDTAAATHLLVTARTDRSASPEGGLTNFIVDATLPGIDIRRYRVLSGDLLAEVRFDHVRVPAAELLGEPGRGWDDLRPALDRGKACLAAQMAGAADALMWKTVDYMNQRVTFGRPISSYQALQHRMATVAQLVYGARHLAYNVLWKLSEGIPCSDEVAMAKFFASDAYRQTTNESHQFHGAYGYSLEYSVQLYWRRMRLDEVILGDSLMERESAAVALGI